MPYPEFGLYSGAGGDDVLFRAGGTDTPEGVVRLNLSTGAHRMVRADSDPTTVDESILSRPRHLTFPGYDGDTAHAWYYAPRNDAVPVQPGRKAPLLVRAHGGPTPHANFPLCA
mgnify:CR=1 FL=1